MKLRLLLAGLLGPAAIVVTSAASAALPAPCVPATMTPRAASVPANLPGFGYSALKAASTDVHLYAMPQKTEVAVTVGPVQDGWLKVVPSAALAVGTTYQLEFAPFCDYGPIPKSPPVSFTVANQAPLPTKIGTLRGTPTVTTKDFGTTQFTYAADYTLDDEMKPWAEVYEIGLEVDGRVIETKPKLAAANASVNINGLGWCDGPIAATKNHKVRLRARLPFAPIVESAMVDVSFDCPAVAIKTPPPGNPTPGSGGGGGQPAGGTTTTTVNSGGCSLSSSTPSPSPLFTGIAMGLVALARRRKNAA